MTFKESKQNLRAAYDFVNSQVNNQCTYTELKDHLTGLGILSNKLESLIAQRGGDEETQPQCLEFYRKGDIIGINSDFRFMGTWAYAAKVQIRYTSTDDLTTLDAYAIGGTAQITDNGDGTYDLWSDDACEFVAFNDNGSIYAYDMNITEINVIKGDTLKYFYYYNGSTLYLYTFGNLPNVTNIYLNNLNSSKATSTEAMFDYCEALTSIDVSNFDTSNVTTMYGMFSNCISLLSVDIGNFDTSKVTNMKYMFYYCESLTSIDFSNLNTSEVTSMVAMFGDCTSLTSLDLTNLDTFNVTDMEYMFGYCEGLTSLDLSNFDTSKVTNMEDMFVNNSLLECITNLDTTNVTNKTNMFEYCSSLVQPDGWNADPGLYEDACLDLTDVDGADWVNPGSCP